MGHSKAQITITTFPRVETDLQKDLIVQTTTGPVVVQLNLELDF